MPPSNPSTDDMNSALLKSPTDDNAFLHNSMFGKFKGFTLKPLPNSTNISNNTGAKVALVHPVAKPPDPSKQAGSVPFRAAPPVPKRPPSSVERNDNENTDPNVNSMKAPALPPPNAGFNTARPLISDPVLKASTCTAKELESVKQIPNNDNTSQMIIPKPPPQVKFQSDSNTAPNKDSKEGTIKRIASFLKNDKKSNSSVNAKQSFKAKPMINREKLKDIKISSPIPIVDNELQVPEPDQTNLVQRTQSMRDPSSFDRKSNVQTFGSMRQPGTVRPKSVVGLRPKSPPPRPPVPTTLKPSGTVKTDLTGTNANFVKKAIAEINDTSSSESDNIYADIDEVINNKEALASNPNAGSNDSMGLLNEIVSEIEKKNGPTLYSNANVQTTRPAAGILPETGSSNNNSANNVIQINENVRTPVARVAPNIPDTVGKLKPNSFSSFKAERPLNTPSSGNVPKSKEPSTTSAKSKPELSLSVTNKPTSTHGSQPNSKPSTNTQLTKSTRKSTSSTSKPPQKPESTSTASVPGGKKNLVSQRAELWENNAKPKLGNKISSSNSSNNNKVSSAGRSSPAASDSTSGASTKPATISKRVKSFTPSSTSASGPAKTNTSVNKRKLSDLHSSADRQPNVSSSVVNRFETKNNKLDNATTNVRFATSNSNSSSSSKPNNTASA